MEVCLSDTSVPNSHEVVAVKTRLLPDTTDAEEVGSESKQSSTESRAIRDRILLAQVA